MNQLISCFLQLMLLLVYVETTSANAKVREEQAVNKSIGWTADGKVIVIRDREHLTKTWLPLFLGDTKFSSFTRKMYRWGFRKTYPPNPQQESETSIFFANDNFQRDDIGLLSKMNSTTAQKLRARIARSGEATQSDTQESGDASQKASVSVPLVNRSSSLDESQPSTTSQRFLWDPNVKTEANAASVPSLIGNVGDSSRHHQERAALLDRLVSLPGPTFLQHAHQNFMDQTSTLRVATEFVDRSHPSQSQALRFSSLSQAIQNTQRPDHVRSTELALAQLIQGLQNSPAIDNSLNSSLLESLIPSILRSEIRNITPVARLPTSEQPAQQDLARNLSTLLSSLQGSTSSLPMAASAMSNTSDASTLLFNNSILDGLLQQQQRNRQQQQQQQQDETIQRLLNPLSNLAFQPRTVQTMLSEQEQIDALAKWIRRNQDQFPCR